MIDLIVDHWPRWQQGLAVTAGVTGFSILFGSVFSLAAGLAMLSRFALVRGASRTYTELFRGTSAVVQLGWFVFAFPQFGLVTISPFQAAVLALSLNLGSYGAEVVRGAIQAVPKGQTEASIALNIGPAKRMTRVILPQAVVGMLPPMGNLYIQILKASAIVSIFLLTDLTRIANNIRSLTGQTTELFTLLLVFYFVLAYVITFFVRAAERVAGRGLDIGRQAAR